jgi:hypothetical protein
MQKKIFGQFKNFVLWVRIYLVLRPKSLFLETTQNLELREVNLFNKYKSFKESKKLWGWGYLVLILIKV